MSGKRQTEFSVDLDSGLVQPARQCLSPNRDDRPAQIDVNLLIVHGISLPPGEFGGKQIEAFFTNQLDCDAHPYFDQLRELRVSTHLLIRRDGEVVQFVPLTERAWHAGESRFRGVHQCNDNSIGIELEGEDLVAYDDTQYVTLAAVASALFDAFPKLDVRRIAGHSDVSPGRKTDPGPVFDWLRLYDDLAFQRLGKP